MTDYIVSEDGKFSVRENAFSFELDTPENGLYRLSAGGIAFTSLYAKPGDFSEELALPVQQKPHRAENGLEVSFDASSRIPFGNVPVEIERKYRIGSGTFTCVSDFALKNSFELKDFSGGGLEITGVKLFAVSAPPKTGCVMPEPEMKELNNVKDGETFYDSNMPPVRLSLKNNADNAEFSIGGDYWKWINASRIDGESRFTITRKGDTLLFAWQIYTFKPAAPDALPPPGRPWRLSYMITWSNDTENAGKTKNYKDILDVGAMKFPESAYALGADSVRSKLPCFESGPVINAMKRWVRSKLADAEEGDIFAIKGVQAAFCFDASHMDRPKLKMLPHRGTGAIHDFIRWANRQLAVKGASLEKIG